MRTDQGLTKAPAKRLPARRSPVPRSEVQSTKGYNLKPVRAPRRTVRDYKASQPRSEVQSTHGYHLAKAPTPVTHIQTVRDINTGKAHQVAVTFHPLAHPHNQGAAIEHATQYGLDTLANLYDRVRPHDGGTLGAVQNHGAGSNVASSIIEAGLHHPVAVTLNSVKSARDMAAAIPSGVVSAVHDPVGAAKAFVADLQHRYGMTDAQTQAYVTKHGFTTYGLDAAAALSLGGATTGRLALRAARAGDETANATKYFSKARPAIRTSGGAAKAQKLADRPMRIVGQRILDSRRAAHDAKMVAKTDEVATTAPRATAVAANTAAGKTVEVTPRFDHFANKAQRMSVALTKSRAVQRLKSEQHRKLDRFAREHLAGLNQHEKRAFYYAYTGLTPAADPAGALRELSKREADITTAREAAGTGPVRKRIDELKTIDLLKAHADKAFTPKLKDTVEKLREQDIHISREDPGLTAGQRLTRRYAQQAQHLGVERGTVPPVDLKVQLAEAYSKLHDPQTGAHLENVHVSEYPIGGKPSTQVRAEINLDGKKIGRLTRHYVSDGTLKKEITHVDPAYQKRGIATRLSRAEEQLAPAHGAARVRVNALTDAGKALNAHLGQWQQDGFEMVRDLPRENFKPRLTGPIHTQESLPDYIRRVQAKADERGLGRPGYFPSEKYANQDFAARAAGGTKATGTDFRYTGKLFSEGRQNTDPNVYLTGLARSIKRKHNWKLVADQFDAHTLPGLQHMSMAQLKNALDTRGIDPRTVEFWHPGRFRKSITGPGSEGGVRNLEDPNVYGDHVTGGQEMGLERLQTALRDAQTPPARDTAEYVKDKGWSAVPKSAHNEIHSSINQGALATAERVSNTVFKAVPSRLLLGANPVWNAFQIASNAMISTGAAGAAFIPHLVREFIPQKYMPEFMQRANLYAHLSPESRDEVDALLGEGASAHARTVHMGSTLSGSLPQRYRALKAHPMWDRKLIAGKHGPAPRDLRPFEAGFRLDRWQNAKFRRALLFHSMKDYGKKLTPQRVEEILHDPAQADAHAKFVNDWLGDYTTMTSLERHVNNLPFTPMFYGYIRHSLRLMFRTMPSQAPIRLEVLAKLGQLQHQELEKLGVAGLPWAAGKFYWTDHGQLKEFDLARANPALNTVTDLTTPNRLIGALPPALSIAADLATHRNNYADRGWAVGGRPAAPLAKAGDFTLGQYARIALNEALGLTNAYRLAVKHTEFGPQGDDSLAFDQRPTHHKSKQGKARDRAWTAQDKADSGNWLGDLVPMPRDSRDQDIAKAKKQAAGQTKKFTHRSKAGYFGGAGGGSSSSGYFGAGK